MSSCRSEHPASRVTTKPSAVYCVRCAVYRRNERFCSWLKGKNRRLKKLHI